MTALCAFSIFLYAVGNRIGFMDRTQIWLLKAVSLLGLLMGIGASYGFLLDIVYSLFGQRRFFIFWALAYIILSAIGILAAGLANFILVALSGTGP